MSSMSLLLLLQFIVLAVTVSAQLEVCGTRTCCPGKICGLNSKGTKERCTYAETCDQLECPTGFQCVASGRPKTPGKRNKVKCRISCDNVTCPSFLECKTKGSGLSSYAKCKYPRRCDPTTCPLNTACTGRRRYGLCTANTCTGVNCGEGASCVEGIARRGRIYTKFLRMVLGLGRGKRSHSRRTLATCIARCTNSTCPTGLVCEERKHEIRCRAPRTCDELTCPVGQICRVSTCGKKRRHTHTHSKSKSKSIAQCVPLAPSPSSITEMSSSSSDVTISSTEVISMMISSSSTQEETPQSSSVPTISPTPTNENQLA
uniref:Uncharacterized protein n=1 Tax=Amphimedon queenslandica TaxID=400682 RepID=A0A1X7VC74_AMPQE